MKKTIALAAALSMLLLAAGCDSEEQKQINAQNIARAKDNATRYIEEKYGFIPSVTNATLERQYGMFGSMPMSEVLVEMEHQGKSFSVYIDGQTENTEGADSYQAEEIHAAVEAYVRERISDIYELTILNSKVTSSFDPIEEDCKYLFTPYYDGGNLKEVLSDAACSIVGICTNTDLSLCSAEAYAELLGQERSTITLYAARSAQGAKQIMPCMNRYYYNKYEKLAVYADTICIMKQDQTEIRQYTLGQTGNIFYYVEGNSPEKAHIRLLDHQQTAEWMSDSAKRVQIPQKSYEVETDQEGFVYLYIPVSELPENQQEMRIIGRSHNTKRQEYCYYESSYVIIGEYCVIETYKSNLSPPEQIAITIQES